MTDTVQVVEIRLDAIKDPAIFRAMLVPEGEIAPGLQAVSDRVGFAAWGPAGALQSAGIPTYSPLANSPVFTSIAAMSAASDLSVGQIAILVAGGRSGEFDILAGTTPAGDAQWGIYVPSSSPGVYLQRRWDGINCLPEWFGAVVNDETADAANTDAINAALTLGAIVLCGAGDYFVSDTIALENPFAKLKGLGYNVTGGRGARIVCTNGTSDICRLGPATPPYDGGGNIDFSGLLYGVELSDIELGRTVAPSTDTAPIGVKIQFTLEAAVINVKSQDSITNFAWEGNVDLRIEGCHATRGRAGVGTAPDLAVGYHAITGTGAAGATSAPWPPLTNINGNASVRVHYCHASLGITTNCYGMLLDGYFTDHSIVNFETAACATGIMVQGDGATENSSTNQSIRRNANLEIVRPWLDTFSTQGIRIDDLDKYGIVRIEGGYYGPASGATACVYLTGCNGVVVMDGAAELAMAATAGGTCRGVYAISSTGLSVGRGTVCMEGSYRAVELTDCSNCDIAIATSNNQVVLDHAIYVSGTNTANSFAPKITGEAAQVNDGIYLAGTGSTRCFVDVSSMNWGVLAGADDAAKKANRVLYNGTGLTAAGAFGTGNYAGPYLG